MLRTLLVKEKIYVLSTLVTESVWGSGRKCFLHLIFRRYTQESSGMVRQLRPSESRALKVESGAGNASRRTKFSQVQCFQPEVLGHHETVGNLGAGWFDFCLWDTKLRLTSFRFACARLWMLPTGISSIVRLTLSVFLPAHSWGIQMTRSGKALEGRLGGDQDQERESNVANMTLWYRLVS